MNVTFHTIAAIGVTAALVDSQSEKLEPAQKKIAIILVSLIAGVISHGILDYIPHCYPIPSKIDVVAGAAIIFFATYMSNRYYQPLIFSVLIGSILPDIVDLLPNILNKYLNMSISTHSKLFPWHWKIYSGSIYNGDCNVSNLNHIIIIISTLIICAMRKKDIKKIFSK